MAIIHEGFFKYLIPILQKPSFAFLYDPVLALAENCIIRQGENALDFLLDRTFSDDQMENACQAFKDRGIIGVADSYFKNKIVNNFVDISVERKLYTLKRGFNSLPATKATKIINGFGYNLTKEQVLQIFASYGLTRDLKPLAEKYDFIDINRRVEQLDRLTKEKSDYEELEKTHGRYLAIRNYLLAQRGSRETVIKNSGMGHGLFFYFWKSFKEYGLLGLVIKGKQSFRESKIGLENEARIVIDKIQHPERKEAYYIQQLKYKGTRIERSVISKILTRWEVDQYRSNFVSNLERLEKVPELEKQEEQIESKDLKAKPVRHVFSKFILHLKSLKRNDIYIDAPGLLVLWVYLEKLEIFPMLYKMGLTSTTKGYCWFELFLLNIARIFYGISSYSRTCTHQEPSLAFFSQVVWPPCNDSFLNGLAMITEKQAFELQKWLVRRLKDLGHIRGRRLAFDFHHIDLDVELDKLRGFGKGPSPKKKVCYNGFRPHIAWDIETGTVIVTEFRKASVRGTGTFSRFVNDFILSVFKGLFETVYIDSEYTGKHVWNFILSPEAGMDAELVACLKQNSFVRKVRDDFLFSQQGDDGFWIYYDDEHVYSSKTFELKWDYVNLKTKKVNQFVLYCVVKKNIHSGRLRCFGTSSKALSSKEILGSYSKRWVIENGIKDLIVSYFLDKCPGTNPHNVNVHFLTVSFCKQLYRMMQEDLVDFIINVDGSIKTLQSMRELLFRQGSAKVRLNKDTIEVHFLNSFKPEVNYHLDKFYQMINKKASSGLGILGGLKLKYFLTTSLGENNSNGLKKEVLDSTKI